MKKTVANVDLGCFKIGAKDVAVQETLRHADVDVTGPDINGCSCSGLACACCQQISVKQLKFKSNGKIQRLLILVELFYISNM